ncbi:hypothetical protein [Chamaesiphon minutus]|uniref:Uncharacterized protein n=1 Tax=Chamaesiphon minutus (strain ATCC 27169 / PCC 6605) TaxID=1173020 RepID=K9UE61_CHAP6|nr:hypothetical protein [Chamaesiphon minutus]AFY93120.1 hypothetical protein Cha6605_2019 [Chamaesiphon minutus PCC 6605]
MNITDEDFKIALAERVRAKGLAAVILEIAQIAEDNDLLERESRRGWGIDAEYLRAMVGRIRN